MNVTVSSFYAVSALGLGPDETLANYRARRAPGMRELSGDVPGLSNVMLATQWLMAPGGLPIAAEGGRLAIETINKMEAVAVKNKSPRRSPAYGRI